MVEVPASECSIALVHTRQEPCPACGRTTFDKGGSPALQIVGIEQTVDGLISTGRIPIAHCPVCGMAVGEINRVVPIELNGLTCRCGGNQFRFAIRSLKPNKVKNPTEWSFDLDIICIECDKNRYKERILNLSRLRRISIGNSRVDQELFDNLILDRTGRKRRSARTQLGGGGQKMIELATAALIAKIASDAVGAFDKIFRGYADIVKKKEPATPQVPPPDFSYVDSPQEKAFVARSRRTGEIYQTVTYQELRAKLDGGDRQHIETLTRAMENYQKQWNAAFEQKSMASGMDIGKFDAQLEYLSRQIAEPLLMVLAFVEKMGLHLDDHYHAARMITEKYLQDNCR